MHAAVSGVGAVVAVLSLLYVTRTIQSVVTGQAPVTLEWKNTVFRPFLMQSDLSVENGLFRLKPKSGFLTQSEKGFFDSTFFD